MPEALKKPRKRKVLVLPHDLNAPGGGTCVGAWVLMALRERHDVTVLSWSAPDLDVANRNFGTDLRREEFRWHLVGAIPRFLLRVFPTRLALLENQILYRNAKRLRESEGFEVVVGAMNEIDVGGPAIQYVHYPWMHWPRPASELLWFHFSPLVRLYRKWAARLSGYDAARVARNCTLANSDWTGRLFEDRYGAPARTVYPPVPGGFLDTPFEERRRDFVCIGRMSPDKRIEAIIEILARIRSRGHEVGLRIIGHKDSPQYLAQLEAAAAPHRDWVSFHHGIARAELVRIVSSCQYGIHAMIDEHFGIAVAELQRAGCIPFVRNGGGAPEIVANDERLVFTSVDDAVEKIDRVLGDDALQQALLQDVATRGKRFTEEHFVREIQQVVESFHG